MTESRRDEEDAPRAISRRAFVGTGLASAVALGVPSIAIAERQPRMPTPPRAASSAVSDFELDELSVAELQQGMESGRWSAHKLVELYLGRIDEIDRHGPMLNAVIETNPDALAIADSLDHERAANRVRGPLHGIPVLIKDNIDVGDKMLTTAGSLALVDAAKPKDADLVANLRAAGAIILGKTNLSEWANFRSTNSTSGWSGRGGQTHNPYVLDRSPSGSSSGSGAAAAASLCAVAVGTETDGSITSPSQTNGLVGIKPTVGLISGRGIVPISHSQDTAGPMCRSVSDAAILLGVLAGKNARADYAKSLDANGLQGARIGVARERYFGSSPAVSALIEDAIRLMKDQGAVIIDPANIPTAGKFGDSEFEVLLYEFKADLNKYLAARGVQSPVGTLEQLIAWNSAHKEQELPYFGQEIFEQAQKKGPLTDAAYKKALAHDHLMARTKGIDAVMTKHKLDALVAPTGGPAWHIDFVNGDCGTGGFTEPAAVAGYPHITVPAGLVSGLPIGVSFVGRAWSEAKLIKLAYAFEQASKARKKPTFAQRAPGPELGATV